MSLHSPIGLSAPLRASLLAVALLLVTSALRAEPVAFSVPIMSADAAEKPRVLRAKKGDAITIEWSADKPLVVHIHPYDIEQELKPGTPSRSQFTANISGRFPIEAHPAAKKSDRKIVAYLEVLPR